MLSGKYTEIHKKISKIIPQKNIITDQLRTVTDGMGSQTQKTRKKIFEPFMKE